MSSLSSFLKKKMIGFPCTLPMHMQGKLHNDWFGPLKNIPRSWNARGPRCRKDTCECGGGGYLAWPPRLVEGKGVARWESNAAQSIILIPDLVSRKVSADDVYEKTWTCVEMQGGHPNFRQVGSVFLKWKEMPWSEIESGALAYSPSALQKFSPSGWIKLDPSYTSWWTKNDMAELKALQRGVTDGEAEDKVWFFRKGTRPDHLDVYYNVDKVVPIGAAGLHWE